MPSMDGYPNSHYPGYPPPHAGENIAASNPFDDQQHYGANRGGHPGYPGHPPGPPQGPNQQQQQQQQQQNQQQQQQQPSSMYNAMSGRPGGYPGHPSHPGHPGNHPNQSYHQNQNEYLNSQQQQTQQCSTPGPFNPELLNSATSFEGELMRNSLNDSPATSDDEIVCIYSNVVNESVMNESRVTPTVSVVTCNRDNLNAELYDSIQAIVDLTIFESNSR